MAHELGHVKSGHVLYYQIAEFLPVITEAIGDATFGVGALLGAGVQVALLNWRRKSEHTADRAGLLVVQDLQVALSALMKLAGLPQRYSKNVNVDDFVAQARAFEGHGQRQAELVREVAQHGRADAPVDGDARQGVPRMGR